MWWNYNYVGWPSSKSHKSCRKWFFFVSQYCSFRRVQLVDHSSLRPAKRKDRNRLLEEIVSLNNLCSSNWLIEGDFNVIRWEIETSTKHPAKHSMNKFNSVINRLGLLESPLTNGNFTRSNLRVNAISSRLDCFLYTPPRRRKIHCPFFKNFAENHFC